MRCHKQDILKSIKIRLEKYVLFLINMSRKKLGIKRSNIKIDCKDL